MKSAKVGSYPLTFLVFLAAFIVLGAISLTLIFTGEPAYPVRVFGSAETSDNIASVDWIRPNSVEKIPRGHVQPGQLLPLPVVLPGAEGAAGPAGDSVYASLPDAAQLQLDRARVAAQAGNEALSLSIYRQLIKQYPDNRFLLLEHISVLSTLGRHVEAANLVLSSMPRFGGDYELLMAGARNLWWGGQAMTADSVIDEALRSRPASEEALRLRSTIRPTTQPSLEQARRWAAASTGWAEQLILARAYVREQQFPASLAPYQLVLARNEASDSLLLEVASAAAAADSLHVLDDITQQLIARNPNDVEARLRLARAYSWSGDHVRAVSLYSDVIALNGDPAIMLEKANVLVWAGREGEAAAEVQRVLQYSPRNVDALKLAGDLSYYRGDWKTALGYYETAATINPLHPGLAAAIGRADELRAQARLASLPVLAADAYDASMDMYADNQDFRWVSMQAGRAFNFGNSSVRLAGEHAVAEKTMASGVAVNPGYTALAEGRFRVGDGFTLFASGGVSSFNSVGTSSRYALAVTVHNLLGTQTTFGYTHEPAARRLGSVAALQAEVMSDRVHVTSMANRGAWSAYAQAEAEQLDSRLGGSRRAAVALSVTRKLNDKWSAGASLSALATDQAAPQAAGWGSLYWSPEHYMEPALRLSYRHRMSERWSLEAAVQSGYGLVRERAIDRRFAGTAVPTGTAIVDLRYQSGPWTVGASANYGGALTDGYRAGTLRVQGSYRVGQ